MASNRCTFSSLKQFKFKKGKTRERFGNFRVQPAGDRLLTKSDITVSLKTGKNNMEILLVLEPNEDTAVLTSSGVDL